MSVNACTHACTHACVNAYVNSFCFFLLCVTPLEVHVSLILSSHTFSVPHHPTPILTDARTMSGDHSPGPSRAPVAAGLETHFALVQDTCVFRAERIAQQKWWTDHIAALFGHATQHEQTQPQRIAFEGKAAYLAAYKKDTRAMEHSLWFFSQTHCNGQGRCTCGKSIMWSYDTQDLHRCNLARREQAFLEVTLQNKKEAQAASAPTESSTEMTPPATTTDSFGSRLFGLFF